MARVSTPLGAMIRNARKKRGLTQSDLSKLSGVSNMTIQRMEREDRKTTAGNLKAVISALGTVRQFDSEESDLEQALWTPITQFLAERKKQDEKEKAQMNALRPLLHQRVDLLDHYGDFMAVFDVVNRFRSMEEALAHSKPVIDETTERVFWVTDEDASPEAAPIDEGDSAHGEA